MKDAHYTRQERHILLWLRLMTAAFLLVGGLFAAQPTSILQYIDDIGITFFGFPSLKLPFFHHQLWWISTLALMTTLAYGSFLAQKNWIRNHNIVPLVILAKGLTAMGLGVLIYTQPDHFFYIVGAALDGLLCLITAYAYFKAISSRSYAQFKR